MAFRAVSAEDRFGFQTSGRVRIMHPWEKPALIAVAIVAAAGEISIMFASFMPDPFGLMTIIQKILLSILWIFVFASIAAVIMAGKQWKYDANEKQFNLHIPKKPDVIFFYDDIEEVRFTPTRLLRHERGYRVLIRTKYRDFTYNYIYTKNRVDRSPQGSPFFIIAERAGLTEQLADGVNITAVWRRAEQGG